MMNVTGTNVNNSSQLAFRAKAGDRRMIHEFIDKSNDLTMELLNKDRPIAEKREIAIRKILSNLKIKSLFAGKKIKFEKATNDHINNDVEADNNVSRDIYLEGFRDTNPMLYKEILQKDAKYKIAQMSNIELIKEFLKGLLKKQSKNEYEKCIEKAVNDGVIDAEHAGKLLLNHKIDKSIKDGSTYII